MDGFSGDRRPTNGHRRRCSPHVKRARPILTCSGDAPVLLIDPDAVEEIDDDNENVSLARGRSTLDHAKPNKRARTLANSQHDSSASTARMGARRSLAFELLPHVTQKSRVRSPLQLSPVVSHRVRGSPAPLVRTSHASGAHGRASVPNVSVGLAARVPVSGKSPPVPRRVPDNAPMATAHRQPKSAPKSRAVLLSPTPPAVASAAAVMPISPAPRRLSFVLRPLAHSLPSSDSSRSSDISPSDAIATCTPAAATTIATKSRIVYPATDGQISPDTSTVPAAECTIPFTLPPPPPPQLSPQRRSADAAVRARIARRTAARVAHRDAADASASSLCILFCNDGSHFILRCSPRAPDGGSDITLKYDTGARSSYPAAVSATHDVTAPSHAKAVRLPRVRVAWPSERALPLVLAASRVPWTTIGRMLDPAHASDYARLGRVLGLDEEARLLGDLAQLCTLARPGAGDWHIDVVHDKLCGARVVLTGRHHAAGQRDRLAMLVGPDTINRFFAHALCRADGRFRIEFELDLPLVDGSVVAMRTTAHDRHVPAAACIGHSLALDCAAPHAADVHCDIGALSQDAAFQHAEGDYKPLHALVFKLVHGNWNVCPRSAVQIEDAVARPWFELQALGTLLRAVQQARADRGDVQTRHHIRPERYAARRLLAPYAGDTAPEDDEFVAAFADAIARACSHWSVDHSPQDNTQTDE